jgi:prophage DNA circulation protein
VVVEQEFDSYDEAVAARDEITDLLDEQADEAADDTYPALMQLRADLVKAVPGEGADLPRLLAYTPPATVPSLVLAHRLYGDVTKELEVVARNKVRHPGFVTGGRELEVVSRD